MILEFNDFCKSDMSGSSGCGVKWGGSRPFPHPSASRGGHSALI